MLNQIENLKSDEGKLSYLFEKFFHVFDFMSTNVISGDQKVKFLKIFGAHVDFKPPNSKHRRKEFMDAVKKGRDNIINSSYIDYLSINHPIEDAIEKIRSSDKQFKILVIGYSAAQENLFTSVYDEMVKLNYRLDCQSTISKKVVDSVAFQQFIDIAPKSEVVEYKIFILEQKK